MNTFNGRRLAARLLAGFALGLGCAAYAVTVWRYVKSTDDWLSGRDGSRPDGWR